ncbi:hypothetical protein AMECASPLE_032112 [Ameca splendens]|uniref:Secreted protein n=1 Tax=Ameca splendens TaxID=208324 RepID=A0ABV0YTK1_9TELE
MQRIRPKLLEVLLLQMFCRSWKSVDTDRRGFVAGGRKFSALFSLQHVERNRCGSLLCFYYLHMCENMQRNLQDMKNHCRFKLSVKVLQDWCVCSPHAEHVGT